MKPIRLDANQLHHFYRGGERIARFRGIPSEDPYAPEDWVGSTTERFGEDGRGLTRLADGGTLRDAIAAAPEPFLGAAHVRRFGPEPALLVKLLDAGQRLPVHCHPDREFAQAHLGLATGKTETWLIVESEDASVHLGFREDVEAGVVAGWVERQDRDAMLGALHELPVVPGDRVYVPAGLPHAIGEGILLVELQEPADLSVLLEYDGFQLDGPRDGHLGLGFDVALGCLNRTALDSRELAHLKRSADDLPEARPGVTTLLPPEADAFFRAERVRPSPAAALEPGFSILVAVAGRGRLETELGDEVELARGDTVLVPYAAGEAELTGEIDVLRCLPPSPEA
ncbi:MAG: class I mannose-6-phosphate isomerase [Gaiellaceae bacterium]